MHVCMGTMCVSRHTSLSCLVIICFQAHWSYAISNDAPNAIPQKCTSSIVGIHH